MTQTDYPHAQSWGYLYALTMLQQFNGGSTTGASEEPEQAEALCILTEALAEVATLPPSYRDVAVPRELIAPLRVAESSFARRFPRKAIASCGIHAFDAACFLLHPSAAERRWTADQARAAIQQFSGRLRAPSPHPSCERATGSATIIILPTCRHMREDGRRD